MNAVIYFNAAHQNFFPVLSLKSSIYKIKMEQLSHKSVPFCLIYCRVYITNTNCNRLQRSVILQRKVLDYRMLLLTRRHLKVTQISPTFLRYINLRGTVALSGVDIYLSCFHQTWSSFTINLKIKPSSLRLAYYL